MKYLFYLILGSLVGWFIWGIFTKDFSADGYSLLLTGLILGFLIGRRNPKEETE
ncbi:MULTISPECIES: tRNA U-34 5-methylaminomethyl-2-thiouridine biosynthesis protein [unclassified Psychrobacillus]|uniref:tRNA U-34 5-methylaminomethyl-2-thiouridine biosynthesis protein n=1 Tax=unclassified Psychrobacillus TaxID=2636677 RepID=UPI00249876C5|nr:tRNA U-34 5-methylaminomethyl-2-thiouridine biosynthesis protein [Psychrobacillus sp. NEAU-3TGS]MDI2588534.1 tRNA U-34 5-methylaminomethyl-2-thiouridine biosynthesis protein [Psychrobacillus sp. NEAU-3TGS]